MTGRRGGPQNDVPNAVLSSRPSLTVIPNLSTVIPNALIVIPNGVRNLRSPSDGLPITNTAFM